MDDAADAFFVLLWKYTRKISDWILSGKDWTCLFTVTLRVIHESRPANRRAFSLIEAFRLSPTSSKGYPLPVQTGDSEWYGWKRLIPTKVLDQRPLYKSRFYHRTLLPVHQEQGIIFYNKTPRSMKINDARPVAFKYPTIGILLKIRYSLGKTLMCQINYFHIFLFSIYHYQSS